MLLIINVMDSNKVFIGDNYAFVARFLKYDDFEFFASYNEEKKGYFFSKTGKYIVTTRNGKETDSTNIFPVINGKCDMPSYGLAKIDKNEFQSENDKIILGVGLNPRDLSFISQNFDNNVRTLTNNVGIGTRGTHLHHFVSNKSIINKKENKNPTVVDIMRIQQQSYIDLENMLKGKNDGNHLVIQKIVLILIILKIIMKFIIRIFMIMQEKMIFLEVKKFNL